MSLKRAAWSYSLMVLCLPFAAQSASFDCEKASTAVERLICSSSHLSELDAELSQRYEKALPFSSISPTNEPVVRKQQREWLRNVRNKCKDQSCLISAYRARIEQFEWTTTHGKKNPLCEELRVQTNRRTGLTSYALPEVEIKDQDGTSEATGEIGNVDVDGDGTSDRILLSRTGSASLIPPDNSWFSVVLSTTGKEHKVEAQRLMVIGYKSRYYLLTANYGGEEGPVTSDVYGLGRSGLRKLCSYDCGLPDGYCAIND